MEHRLLILIFVLVQLGVTGCPGQSSNHGNGSSEDESSSRASDASIAGGCDAYLECLCMQGKTDACHDAPQSLKDAVSTLGKKGSDQACSHLIDVCHDPKHPARIEPDPVTPKQAGNAADAPLPAGGRIRTGTYYLTTLAGYSDGKCNIPGAMFSVIIFFAPATEASGIFAATTHIEATTTIGEFPHVETLADNDTYHYSASELSLKPKNLELEYSATEKQLLLIEDDGAGCTWVHTLAKQ